MAGNSKSDGYNSIFLVAFKQRDIEDGVCSTQLDEMIINWERQFLNTQSVRLHSGYRMFGSMINEMKIKNNTKSHIFIDYFASGRTVLLELQLCQIYDPL
jgi:hypothetical protein